MGDKRTDYALMCALAVLLALMVLLAATMPSAAHSWYDQKCCSGRDCSPVPDDAIKAESGGYRLHLGPGDHPLIGNRTIDVLIPYGDTRIHVSQDDRQHACIGSASDTVFCIYVLYPGY